MSSSEGLSTFGPLQRQSLEVDLPKAPAFLNHSLFYSCVFVVCVKKSISLAYKPRRPPPQFSRYLDRLAILCCIYHGLLIVIVLFPPRYFCPSAHSPAPDSFDRAVLSSEWLHVMYSWLSIMILSGRLIERLPGLSPTYVELLRPTKLFGTIGLYAALLRPSSPILGELVSGAARTATSALYLVTVVNTLRFYPVEGVMGCFAQVPELGGRFPGDRLLFCAMVILGGEDR